MDRIQTHLLPAAFKLIFTGIIPNALSGAVFLRIKTYRCNLKPPDAKKGAWIKLKSFPCQLNPLDAEKSSFSGEIFAVLLKFSPVPAFTF